MTHSFKRILSLVLTFAMVLSCVPAQALATEYCSHTYEVTTTDATCTEDGTMDFVCTLCGDSYSEPGATAEGHIYQETAAVDATCADAGSVTYTCSACGDVYEEEIPATGAHVYAEGFCVCGAEEPSAPSEEVPTEAPVETPAEEPAEEPQIPAAQALDGGNLILPAAKLDTTGEQYATLKEAVAAAKNEERTQIILLDDCDVDETIRIDAGIRIINEGSNAFSITAEEGVDAIFEIGEGGDLNLENVKLAAQGKYAINLTAGDALAFLMCCDVSGATEAAINLEDVAYTQNGYQNVQIYSGAVSGATALNIAGSNAQVVVAMGNETNPPAVLSANSADGAIVINGDGHTVQLYGTTLENAYSGGVLATMNGDSYLLAGGINGGMYDSSDNGPMPIAGNVLRYREHYLGSLEAVYDKISNVEADDNYVTGTAHRIDVMSDYVVTSELNGAQTKDSVHLHLVGNSTLTVATGAALTLSGDEHIYGNVEVQQGATLVAANNLTLNGNLTVRSGGTVLLAANTWITGNLTLEDGANVIVDAGKVLTLQDATVNAPDGSITLTPPRESGQYGAQVVGLSSNKPLRPIYEVPDEAGIRSALAAFADEGYGAAEIRPTADITLQSPLIIPENVSLWIQGKTLEVPANCMLENYGRIAIQRGGKLHLLEGSEMLNVGTVENNGAEFINDGFINNMGDLSDCTISGEGDCRNYDPLQLDLFEAMVKHEDYYLPGQFELAGDLSVNLNHEGQDKWFVMSGDAKLTVPANCILYIRSNARMEAGTEILIEEGGKLIIDGYLEMCEGSWLENNGMISIENGGKLHMKPGSEMLNNADVTRTSNSVFINEGCVNDLGNMKGAISENKGEHIQYDMGLQNALFAAMNAKEDYTLEEDYTLQGNLSVRLNHAEQDKLFTIKDATLTVPGGCVLSIQSRVKLEGTAKIVVQDGGELHLKESGHEKGALELTAGTSLEICEYSWMENYGVININGGTLHIHGGAEILNCGEMTNNDGQFINDGCINDCGNILNLITGNNNEYYKYDAYLQQELFDAMAANTGYDLTEDYTLEGNLSIVLGGRETEHGWEDNFFVIENATLTVPAGCTLGVHSHVYLKGENAKIVVEEGGKLIANAQIHEGFGTVYLKQGADLEVGEHTDLYCNIAMEGRTQDFLSAHWLYWDNGHYNSIEEFGSAPARELLLQPGNQYQLIFYINRWDSVNERWNRTPVAKEDLACDKGLYLENVEDRDIAPGATDTAYFYRLYANEDPELWGSVLNVCYAPDENVDAVTVRIDMEVGQGIYSEPWASYDTYLNEVIYAPGQENAFYFINTDPNVEMIDVELTAWKGRSDENGQWIEEEIDAANIVKYDTNVWKIALKKQVAEDLDYGFNIALDIILRDGDGNEWRDHRDISCTPFTHRRGKWADAEFRINGVNYMYYAKYDQFLTWNDETRRDEIVKLPSGVSYDYDSNTLFLRDAYLNNLHVNYSYFDDYWEEDYYCLPSNEFTIHLTGENSISSDEREALEIMDSLEKGIKVNISGDGSLYVYNGNGHNAANVQFTDLTIGESVHVTFEVEGENFWQNEQGEWVPCTMHGLNGFENSTLTIADSAEVNFEIPAWRVNRQGTPFEYRGLANFERVIVSDQSVVNLDVLHLYNGQKFFQRGGTVNVRDHGAVEQNGRIFYEPVHVDGRRGEDGPVSVLNISGGQMNVEAYSENVNARASMVQATNGAVMQIAGGKLNIRHNVLGPAIFVGYGASLYHSGGTTTWSDELYEGYDREQYPGNTFIIVEPEATANFTGGLIRISGGESYLRALGNMNEGTNGVKWTGTTLEGNNTRIYLEGGEIEYVGSVPGTFCMSGGSIHLDGNSCIEVRGAEAVFTGGVVNMVDSMLKNGNVFAVEGNAVLNFDLYDNTQTPAGYEEPFAIDNYAYMPISGNGRINININRSEDNWATGILNSGCLHQMGGAVTINSSVKREAIKSGGTILLNAGEMNLNCVNGIEQYWNGQEGDKINVFEMQEGMTLNINASITGMCMNADTVGYFNGGSMNIYAGRCGMSVLSNANIHFDGGIHHIEAGAEEGNAAIVLDYAVDDSKEPYGELPNMYINQGAVLTVTANVPFSCWHLNQNEEPHVILGEGATSSVPLNWQASEFDGHYNYCLYAGDELVQDIRFNDALNTLQDWLNREGVTPDENGRYHLNENVIVTEDMELRDENGQPIILDVHGSLTVHSGVKLTVPEGSHLVAQQDGRILVNAGGQIVNNGLMANDGGILRVYNSAAQDGYVHGENAILNVHFGEFQIPVLDENGQPTEETKWELRVYETSGIPAEYQKLFGNVCTSEALCQIAQKAYEGYSEVGINLDGSAVEIHKDLTIPENTTLNVNANYVRIAEGAALAVEGHMNLNEDCTLDVSGSLANHGVIEAYGAKLDISGVCYAGENSRMTLHSSNQVTSSMAIHGYYNQAGWNAVLEIFDNAAVTVDGTLEAHGEVRVGNWDEAEGYVAGTLNINDNGQMDIYGHLNVMEGEDTSCSVVNVNEGGTVVVKYNENADIYGSVYVGGKMNVAGTLEMENYMDIQGKVTVTGALNNYGQIALYGELDVNGGTVNNGRDYTEELDGYGWYGDIYLMDNENGSNRPTLTANGGTVNNLGSIYNYSPKGSIDLSGGTYNPGAIMNPDGNTMDGEIVLSYFSDNTIAACNDELKKHAYLLYEGDNAATAINMAAVAKDYKEGIAFVVGKMTVGHGQVLQADNIIVTQGSELLVNGRVTAWVKLNVRSDGTLTIGANGAVYLAGDMWAFPENEKDGEMASVINNRGTLECGAHAYVQIDGEYNDFGMGTLMQDAEFNADGSLSYGTICGESENIYTEYQTLSVLIEDDNGAVKIRDAIDAVMMGGYKEGILWLRTAANVSDFNLMIPDKVTLQITAEGEHVGSLHLADRILHNDGEIYVNAPGQVLTAEGENAYYTGNGDYYGSCSVVENNSGLTWNVRSGVLTISGEGAMLDYHENPAPWNYIDYHKVELGSNVTYIGKGAFANGGEATVVIPKTLAHFGDNCFGADMYLKIHHNSAAEELYLHREMHNAERIIFVHTMNAQGVCEGCQANMVEQLKKTQARDVVEELKNIDADQLKNTMEENADLAQLVAEKEQQLLEEKSYSNDEKLTVSTNSVATDEKVMDAFGNGDVEGAAIVGAAMNAPDAAGEINLVIGDPENAAIEDEQFETFNTAEGASVLFSMGLEGDGIANDSKLEIPVIITLPVPQSILNAIGDALENIVVMHYHEGDPDGEQVKVNPYWGEDGKAYVSFVVSGFSNFLMGVKAEEVTVTVKVNRAAEAKVATDTDPDDVVITYDVRDNDNRKVRDMGLYPIILDASGKEVTMDDAVQTPGTYTVKPGYENAEKYHIIKETVATLIVEDPIYVCINTTTEQKYETVSEALAEAQSGDTVVMLRDALATNGKNENIAIVNAGTTLDLNGHYVEIANLLAFGYVIDSKGDSAADLELEGDVPSEVQDYDSDYNVDIQTGGIVNYKSGAEHVMLHTSNDGYMPIYDTSTYSYKFYRGALTNLGSQDNFAQNNVMFGSRIIFEEAEGYAVLAKSDNSLKVVADLSWEGTSGLFIEYQISDKTVRSHGDNMYKRWQAGQSLNRAMALTIRGIKNLTPGTEIIFKPELCAESGYTYTGTDVAIYTIRES